MPNPKVSVVLSVYNCEKFVGQSIDSVLGQRFQDYEFFICDDGSTDSSADVIASRKDPRIKFIRNEKNLGWPVNFNRIARLARGEYIRIWCHDDLMNPECLEREVRFQSLHPEIGFSYCAYDLISSQGRIIIPAKDDLTPEIIQPAIAAQIMFYHGSICANLSTVMLPRRVIEEMGSFREDMKVAYDFEMWVRITQKFPIGFINNPLIKLRFHPGQYSLKKGVGVDFMREQKEIFAALFKRLPEDISAYARKYTYRRLLIMNTHYMVRAFLGADFKNALASYKEISRQDSVWLGLLLWFFTLNGRLFRKKPRYSELTG